MNKMLFIQPVVFNGIVTVLSVYFSVEMNGEGTNVIYF